MADQTEPTTVADEIAAMRKLVACDESCAGCGHSRGKHTLVDGPCLVRFADPLTEDDLCQCDEFEPSW